MLECSTSFVYGVIVAYGVVAAFLGGYVYRGGHVDEHPG